MLNRPFSFARVALGAGVLAVASLSMGAASEAEARVDLATLNAPAARVDQAPDGAKLYARLCAACHQANGQGVPSAFPPVAGSEWVTGPEERLVKIILHGITGDIEVAGEVYSSTMPPWGGSLNDAELAALATHMRNSWGNKAPAVTATTVARIRKETADRKKPWTAEELALSSATVKE